MTLDLLSVAWLGEPMSAHGLTVVPLFPRRDPLDFLDLASAVQQGVAEVVEAKAEDVPIVKVGSVEGLPVHVAEGSMLVGGMQDRAAVRPAWVRSGAVVEVPVHCVERRRWRYRGAEGSARSFRPTRSCLTFRSARLSGPESQELTWRLVEERRRARGRADGGGSLHELREDHDVGALAQDLELPVSASGAVIYWDHPATTAWPLVEWYASPGAFRGAWPTICEGVLEAHLGRLRARGVAPAAAEAPRIRLAPLRRRLEKLTTARERQFVQLDADASATRWLRRGHTTLAHAWTTSVADRLVHASVVRGLAA